jgi:hypothetical protein
MNFWISFYKQSIQHFIGCYALTVTFGLAGMSIIWAAGLVIFLGAAWEYLDTMNYNKGWKFWLLDPGGGDILDFVADIAGVVLGIIVIAIFGA